MNEQICKFKHIRDDGLCIHYIDGCGDDSAFCKREREFFCKEVIKEMQDKNKETERVLSVSQFEGFIHCRYSWYLSHIAEGGIQLKNKHKAPALKMGSIWDKFQNKWYSGKKFSKDELWQLCEKYNLDSTDTFKLYGLITAWHKMDFQMPRTGEPQAEFYHKLNDTYYHGKIDILYPDQIIENKLSGKPQFYTDKFYIERQGIIYLLSQPHIKEIIVRITRTPQSRLKKGETLEEYANRTTTEILSKPSYYFIGYDRKQNIFGVKFHRNEFDFDSFTQDFEHVMDDMEKCRADITWCYQNKKACLVPAECQYYNICKIGGVNWDMYEHKKKNKEGEGVEDNENN